MEPVEGRHALRGVGVRNHTGLDDRTLRKSAARGELVQVWRGLYVSAALWSRLDHDGRRRLRIVAAQQRADRPPVVSHRSAALLHGIPFTGAKGDHVDVLTTASAGTRKEHGFSKHATRATDLEIAESEGVLVTSIARTVVELALVLPFRDAVAAADWALAAGITREQLLGLLDELAVGAARRRGRRVLDFADARSGSAGESKSRALIDELGFPAPELQVDFDDHLGFIGSVDFFWSEAALIGEFDGAVKYRDPTMLRGRTPEEALLDEKRRGDRLQAKGPRLARWMHRDLTLQRLGGILFGAGLRTVR